jgi:hypothetical protein
MTKTALRESLWKPVGGDLSVLPSLGLIRAKAILL